MILEKVIWSLLGMEHPTTIQLTKSGLEEWIPVIPKSPCRISFNSEIARRLRNHSDMKQFSLDSFFIF